MAIQFKIGFVADTKQLGDSLQGIQRDIQNAFSIRGNISDELKKATTAAMVFEKAMRRATDTDGTVSYSTLVTQLNAAGSSAAKLTTELASGGQNFVTSLNAANSALALTNRQSITLGNKMKEIWRVTTQSMKFTGAQTFIRAVSSEAQQAVRWVTNLNEAVNNIAVVTGKSGDEIKDITTAAIQASRDLKVAAQNYAEGALIFYQQGLDDEEVARRTEVTIKAAKAANQSVDSMSSQLTSIWNNYKMIGEEQERAASVGAALAARTAVDFKDIAQAMQTAAAPAAQMGVEYNQLAAIIATVGDTTQESASVIGNAYKTIFSRFQQLTTTGTDGEVTLNSVSSKLKSLGIEVMNADGTLRNLGQVINEVGEGWDNWSQTQQTAIAQIVGGTRQYGQFLALMQNFDKYQKNLKVAQLEDGSTLEGQYIQALESIDAKMENSAEAWKRAFAELVPEEGLKTFYDGLTDVGELVESIFKTIGGLPGVLSTVGFVLQSKITPALVNGASQAMTMTKNLTATGRIRGINEDFNTSRVSARNARMQQQQRYEDYIRNTAQTPGATPSPIQTQTMRDNIGNLAAEEQKLKFAQQTALINERINTQLKTAVGQRREDLLRMQEQLKMAQENYQVGTDELNLLSQRLERQVTLTTELENFIVLRQRELELERASLQAEQDQLNTQITEAQTALTDAQTNYNDANNSPQTSEAAYRRLLQAQRQVEAAEQRLNQLYTQQGDLLSRINMNNANRLGLNVLRDQGRALNNINGEFMKILKASTDSRAGMITTEEAIHSVTAALREMAAQSVELESADIDGENPYQQLLEQIRELRVTGEDSFDGIIAGLSEALGECQALNEEMEELIDRYNTGRGQQEQGEEERNAGNGGEAPPDIPPIPSDDVAEQSRRNLQGMIEGYVQLSSAVLMVGSAAVNVISTLTNPDLTGWEKLQGILTQMMFILPTLTTNLQSIGAGMLKVAASAGIEAAATEGATVVTVFFGASAKEAWLSLLGPIGLVIAAIAAVVVIIGAVAKAMKESSPIYQLQKAQEESKKLKDALSETQAEAEKLQETFDKYDSVQEALSKCTKGTQEWKDALKAVNDQVLEMINEYPELAQYVEKSVDGALSIDKQGRDLLQSVLSERANLQQAAVIGANQNVREKQLEVDKWKLPSGGTSQYIQDNLQEIVSSTDLTKTMQDIIDKNYLVASAEEWASSVEEMLPALREFQAEIEAAATATKLENEIIADSIIKDSSKLKGVTDSNAMDAGGAVYGQAYKKAYEEALANAKDRFLTGRTARSADEFDKYAEKMGLSNKEGFKATNFKNDGSVSYEFIDEEGKKQVGEATAEMIARFNAAAEASDVLIESLSRLAEVADNLENSEDKGDKALSRFLGKGNLEGANQGEFNDIKADVENAGSAEQYLINQFGENLLQVATDAGYESSEAFVAAFEESLKIDWDSIPEGLRDIETLTLEQAKVLADTYTKVLDISGKEAGEQYVEGLRTALQGVDEDDISSVQNLFSGIDWTKSDALNTFANDMRALGYEIDLSDEKWISLGDTMKDTFKVQPDLDRLVESIKEANDIADKVELGSIISKEDYQILVDYNAELAKYFTILADGTAQMTGDILDFQQTIRETGQQQLRDAIEQFRQQKEELEGVSGSQNYVGEDGENYYSGSKVQTQLDYIEAIGGATAEQIVAWREDLSDGNSTVQVIDEIGEAFDKLGISSETAGAQIQEAMTQLAMSATDANERLQMFKNGDINELALAQAQEAAINADRWDGLDYKEVENYAKYLKRAATESDLLSDELAENQEAAEDVARVTKKMNKGIDELAKGIEDWSDVLEKSDEGSEEFFEALEGIRGAMSDVLDIQEDFLSDDLITENMEDIKLAAEGDAEAIDRLRQAALEDIVLNMEVSGDLSGEALWERVQGLQEELNSLFPDGIEVGTTIDLSGIDEGETSFLDKLNTMILEAGMSAEQVNAMLSGMGFTANFATEPQKVQIREPDKTITHHEIRNRETHDMQGGGQTETWDDVTWTETEPGEVHDGEVDAYSLETTEPGVTAVPKINSLTKTGSGSMNNYSSSNSGGPPPGGKSKSGGGGSKSKEFKKKDKEEVDDQKYAKRYENLTNALEELNDSLTHISNAMNDAWGEARLRQMDAYNKKIQVIAKTQKKLIEETKKYYKEDKAALLATSVGNLAKFDEGEYGDLLNPEDLRRVLQSRYEEALAAYNKAINDYNEAASTADGADAEVEAQKDLYDELVKDLDRDIKALDQFLETRDLLRERMEQQFENIRNWMSQKVEQVKYELEMRIRIPERDLKQLDRFISRIEDIGIISGDTLDSIEKKWDDIMEKMEATWGDDGEKKSGIYRELEILSNINPNNPEHQQYFKDTFGEDIWEKYLEDTSALPAVVVEHMEELWDKLKDYQEELYDAAQEAFDAISRKIEMWFEKLDKIQDKIDTHLSRLEMLENILDVSPIRDTQEGRDAQRKINKAKADNAWTDANLADARFKGAEAVYNDLAAQYDQYYAEFEKIDKDDIERRKEYQFVLKNIAAERDKAYDEMTAAEQDRNAKIGEAAQIMKENLAQEFDMITAEFESGLNGIFSTLEDAMEMFDMKAELRDWYLDPIETKYEFDSLLAKIDKAMEDTSDVETLKKLADYREKIVNWQEEGGNITQKQFEIENKRFELMKEEAAFQDAQAQKTTMRLHRDASGNYTYVYSGDDGDKDQEQKIRDLKNDIYQLEKQAMRAADQMYFQTMAQLRDYIRERDEALRRGDEQYAAMMEEKINDTKQKLANIVNDFDMYGKMMVEDFGQVAYETNGSITAMIGGYQSMDEMHHDYMIKAEEYDQRLIAAAQEMQEQTEKELEELGINYEDLATTIDQEVTKIEGENRELRDDIRLLKTEGVAYLHGLTSEINTWAANFIAKMDAVIKKLEELRRKMDESLNSGNGSSVSGYDEHTDYNAYLSNDYAAFVNSGGKMDIATWLKTYHSADVEERILAGNDRGIFSGKDFDEAIDILVGLIEKNQGTNVIGNGWNYKGDSNKDINIWTNGELNIDAGKVEIPPQPTTPEKGAATGGLFTKPDVTNIAEEGPELVLNAEDTMKILEAVRLVRQKTNEALYANDSRYYQLQKEQARMVDEAWLSTYSQMQQLVKDRQDQLQQEVHIEATFPGVSVAAEIETAFNDLVVQAAQYRRPNRR